MGRELSAFEKRFFRIIYLIFIIPAFGYLLYNLLSNDERDWSNYFDFKKNEHYEGFVAKKYVDFNDHAIEKIVLDNNNIFNLICTEWYKQFDTGDYVIKEKGSLIIKLIKKQTQDTLFFDYRDIEIKD